MGKSAQLSKAGLIGRNIKFSAMGKGITFLVSFILFPFIVSRLGKEIYGIYRLVFSIIAYVAIMDLGVHSAVTKFVAQFKGKNDTETLNKIISTALSFYTLIGIVSALILVVFSLYFDLIFKVAPASRAIGQKLLLITAGASVLMWPSSTFKGAIQGLQRYDWLAVMGSLVQICYAGLAYFLLTHGFGVIQLMIAFLAFIIVGNFLLSIGVYRNLAGLKITFPCFDKETFRMIFKYGIIMFLSSIFGLIIFQTDHFIIGIFVSVSAVTIYAVGTTLQSYIRTINALIGSPIIPAASEMDGKKDEVSIKRLLFRGTKYTTAVFLPMVIITLFFLKPFITHWMGPGFEASVWPAIALMSFWLFNGIIEVGSGILLGKGLLRIFLWTSAVNAIVNLVLSLILVRFLGILGVALGTAIPWVLIGFPWVLSIILKKLKVTFREFFNLSLRNNLKFFLLSAILSIIILKFIYPGNIFWTLLEMGVIYLIVISTYFLFLSPGERQEVRNVVGI